MKGIKEKVLRRNKKADLEALMKKLSEGFGLANDAISADLKLLSELEIRTEMAGRLESMLENPEILLNSISDFSDKYISAYLQSKVERYLSDNSKIIKDSFKTDQVSDAIHYTIVLKRDTLNNRIRLLNFIGDYRENPLSKKYPVFFQFEQPAVLKK